MIPKKQNPIQNAQPSQYSQPITSILKMPKSNQTQTEKAFVYRRLQNGIEFKGNLDKNGNGDGYYVNSVDEYFLENC